MEGRIPGTDSLHSITSRLRARLALRRPGFKTLTSSPTCHSSAYARSEAANSIIKSGVNRILAIIQFDRRCIVSIQVAGLHSERVDP